MILGILALLAAGLAVMWAIKVTFNWVRNKIREKLAKKNVKKVYMATVKKLADECDNKMTKDELNNYDFVMASVNDKEQVEDLDLIKNTDAHLDEEVDRLLTSKREVVITN